jgi:N-acetylglucosaminyldiphosphoundecaprenol N-acetyl-beta-D-mannosaminyltransferase
LASFSEIFGCKFDCYGMNQLTTQIRSAVDDERVCRIATVNVAILVEMQKNRQLSEAIKSADIIVADGLPIVWISKCFGAKLPERIPGADLVERLAEYCSGFRKGIFLLGGTDEVVGRAAEALSKRFHGLKIRGLHHGFFSDTEDTEVVGLINRTGADVLLAGMGVPKQELFLHRNADRLRPLIRIGVGGSLEILAGTRKRAPKCVQRMGMEWAFRLVQEPQRLWRRYLVSNAVFLWLCLKSVMSRNKNT